MAAVILTPVEHDNRNTRRIAPRRKIVGHTHRGCNDPIHLIGQHLLDDRRHVAIVFRHENKNMVAFCLKRAAEFLHSHRIELVIEIGHDQPR